MPRDPQRVELELPEIDLAEHLQPIHDRIQSVEQTASDLRERAAKTEEQVKTLATSNPVADQALALATEARAIAESALKKAEKKAREVPEDLARPIQELDPPEPPHDEDPPADDPPIDPAPRKPWWTRLG